MMNVVVLAATLLMSESKAPQPVAVSSVLVQEHASTEVPSELVQQQIGKFLLANGLRASITRTLNEAQRNLGWHAKLETCVPGSSLETTTTTAEETQLTQDYLAQMDKIASTQLVWEKVEGAIVALYAHDYSPEQILEMTAAPQPVSNQGTAPRDAETRRKVSSFLEQYANGIAHETDRVTAEYIKKRNVVHPPPVDPNDPLRQNSGNDSK